MQERVCKILEFDIIREKLAELCSCELAKKLARNLMPSIEKEVVEQTLKDTDDAVALSVSRGRAPAGGIKEITMSVKRAAGGSMLSFTELLAVAGVLKAARRLQNYVSEFSDEAGQNNVANLISALEINYRLESDIYRCILSEEEMSDDASPELLGIRRKIEKEQNSIREKLNEFVKGTKFSKAMQDDVVTMRGDRYCVPVKSEYRSEVPGIVHDMSGSGQTLFIEPAAVVDSNNKIRELRVQEKQEIERIIGILSGEVAAKQDMLLSDEKLLAEIDFIFAKASLALSMDAHKPMINERGYINIVKGRHPLIEKHKVVPISLYIGEKFRTLVITGPNTGGKTVTLKTTGLFTIMMQSGLLVPCESISELSIFHDVFADIGDEQSISQSLSTFSAHMSNIVKITDACDERSLVLFDELGAGTDPTEGAALAMAVLECVYQKGSVTLATTHYSELKAFTVSTKGFENACCEFNVETLSPTYRLMIGIPGKSNAFAISTKLGLDEVIIDRAREFLSGEDVRFEDMLSDIESKRTQIEESGREIERLKKEADELKSSLAEEKQHLEEQKKELVKKARQDAQKIVSNAKKEADELLSELRKTCSEASRDNLRRAEAIGRKFSEKKDKADEENFKLALENGKKGQRPQVEKLKIGDELYSSSLDAVVSVLKLPDKNGNVYVQAGILKMYCNINDLALIPENKKDETVKTAKKQEKSYDFVLDKAINTKAELDLRGKTAEEAVEETNRYIDDCIIGRISTARIIHGKGTGVLRKAIHEMLRKDRRISEYRLGEYGEGDAGVTVVKIKI